MLKNIFALYCVGKMICCLVTPISNTKAKGKAKVSSSASNICR